MVKTKPRELSLRAPSWAESALLCSWEACPRSISIFADGAPLCDEHFNLLRDGKQPAFQKEPGERIYTVRLGSDGKSVEGTASGMTRAQILAKYGKGRAAAAEEPSLAEPEPTADATEIESGLETGKYDDW